MAINRKNYGVFAESTMSYNDKVAKLKKDLSDLEKALTQLERCKDYLTKPHHMIAFPKDVDASYAAMASALRDLGAEKFSKFFPYTDSTTRKHIGEKCSILQAWRLYEDISKDKNYTPNQREIADERKKSLGDPFKNQLNNLITGTKSLITTTKAELEALCPLEEEVNVTVKKDKF